MKNRGLKLILLIGCFLLVSVSVFAIKGNRKGKGGGEMRAYFKETILPEIQAQRKAFDDKLSNKEKKKITELRARLEVLKANGKQKKGQGRALEEESFELPSAEERAQMRAVEKEKRAIMTEAWAIADKHEAELEEVIVAMEPLLQKWHGEMKLMKEEKLEKMKERRAEKGSPEGRERKGRHGEMRHRGPRGKHQFGNMGMLSNGAMFVLMDPDKDPMEDDAPGNRGPRAFPNPVSDVMNVDLSNYEGQAVTLTVVLKGGEEVKSVQVQAEHEATYQLATGDLSAGMYLLRIKAEGEKAQTIRFIKK
ncbi:T9SS type A sorting domain-containing protein [Persicobacter sp. CCB-QB2]|uniref:T9SS type A sorting domain-containing protein n=1 Tax=Persicobacter sp. CCB-QB2 TaxID=1561025 RepID=UPI0006A9872B|nr:T9SS type A sorting domain-containing protein [Persicobacter sp. CCB-QB2]